MGHRQRDDERRALAVAAFCHDRAPMAISYFPAHSEAYAGAFLLSAGVQALEDHEDLLGKLIVEADAIVLHGEATHFG